MKLFNKIFGIILVTITIILIIAGFFFRKEVYIFYRDFIIKERKEIVLTNNSYAKNTSYSYVSLTNDFIAKDKTHLKNILYTIINSGHDKFTFYCDDDYYFCLEDFNEIIGNEVILSNINNFVHPFNSFQRVSSTTSSDGKIVVEIFKKYTDDDINKLNLKVEEIINKHITSDMNNVKKIEVIHNYIINNSHYASEDKKNYDKATDVLLNGLGICTAYTDAMDLFLAKFNLNYYNITSDTHIWNLVYLNGHWYHLDLTFDDPIVSDGSNTLLKDMFLINNYKLEAIDNGTHKFNKEVYKEAE